MTHDHSDEFNRSVIEAAVTGRALPLLPCCEKTLIDEIVELALDEAILGAEFIEEREAKDG